MDPATLQLLAAVALLVGLGIALRRRYGNLYATLSEALERRLGLRMAVLVRTLGVLTLAAWLAVYLLYGGEREEGLDSLKGPIDLDLGQPATR